MLLLMNKEANKVEAYDFVPLAYSPEELTSVSSDVVKTSNELGLVLCHDAKTEQKDEIAVSMIKEAFNGENKKVLDLAQLFSDSHYSSEEIIAYLNKSNNDGTDHTNEYREFLPSLYNAASVVVYMGIKRVYPTINMSKDLATLNRIYYDLLLSTAEHLKKFSNQNMR